MVRSDLPVSLLTCAPGCSPGSQSGSHSWPWFSHLLPRLAGAPQLHGRPAVLQTVQRPGDLIYLPHNTPHATLNIQVAMLLTQSS